MRLRARERVRIFVRAWLAVIVLVAGCWTTPRPTGPPALLRRQHATGDVLRVCERGDARIDVAKRPPYAMTLRAVYDERILTAARHRFEGRWDTVSASVRFERLEPPLDEPALVTNHTGTPFAFDDRNRTLDVKMEPPASRTDSDEGKLDFTPAVFDLVNVTYPDRAIRKHDTFRVKTRRVVPKTDALPSELAIDVEFTVVRVEPRHVELACKGTQREVVKSGKQSIEVKLDVTCRARIDRLDGRTGRWWIDASGAPQVSWAPIGVRVRTHYDVAVGGVDPEVCVRAAEPVTLTSDN